MLVSSAPTSLAEAVPIRCWSLSNCVLYSARVSGCAARVCAETTVASRSTPTASAATGFMSRAGSGSGCRRHHELQVITFFADPAIEILQRERNRQYWRDQRNDPKVHQIAQCQIPHRKLLRVRASSLNRRPDRERY